MKKVTASFLLLTILMGACSKDIPAATSTATQPAVQRTSTAVVVPVATKPVSSETAVSARQAMISKIENSVTARKSPIDALIPAFQGMTIAVGGGIETGSDGRARMDLVPDGTIVRVGPNSSFTLPELILVNDKPKTTIELLFGTLYILLRGGSLDVKTPNGVATVRGSVLSVRLDDKKRLKAACLEGHCALQNEGGTEVELTEGQESFIDPGAPPSDPQQIDRGEIQDWLDQVPEMPDFFQELPNPDNYPEPALNDGAPATEAPATTAPEDSAPPDDAPSGGSSGGSSDGSSDGDNAP